MAPDPTEPERARADSGLLTRVIEAAARGDQAEVDRVLADHPEQADELRQGLQRLDHLGLIPQVPEQIPSRIGPYRVLERLGQGGMGAVYLAEQREPVHRRVAVKVVKLGMDSEQVLARFQVERQALAMMNHDAIARVFDAGTTERGQLYFAMEHVPGLPITEHCDKHRLSLAERLRLFQRVCAGVQHAHQKGIIHRDLKPSNLLVSTAQGEAVPKIIDFGVARATDSHSFAATVFTEQGMILGTPEYMSPEQAEMSAQDIDTRTDIYSLGVILYELLVGDLPFSGADLRAAGWLGLQRKIRDDDPPKPSTRVKTRSSDSEVTARRRGTSLHSLGRALRGDLDWIVMRALEKDRTRRYASAAALADDIGRHLADEPVSAGPPSASYRLRKLARRYRTGLLAAALVLVALVAGLGLATRFWLEASAQAHAAETARGREAAKVREFDQLAGVVLLEQAVAREKELYPPWPERIPAMRRWLDEDADPLLATRPGIEATLVDLRRQAEAAKGAKSVPFSKAQEFLATTLQDVLERLTRFASEQDAAVRQRLAWAQRIDALTNAHPRARVTWAEVRAAIAKADGLVASELYRAHPIDLHPQTGLVPIGMNPVTRLWEFYELRSAFDGEGDPTAIEIPAHITEGDRAGDIVVGDATGIVFVLLPGGTFTMGSQSEDETRPNFDPAHDDDEDAHSITLAPFFMARHELSQGQWRRLTVGELPSAYKSPQLVAKSQAIGFSNPVEQISWEACMAQLARAGLCVPTEAQWEFACRGTTATPWWTGPDRESLTGTVNLPDQAAKRGNANWPGIADWPELDDGYVVHAPVDTMRPNAFGLHHVHGNVMEWCRDWWVPYSNTARPGDGLRELSEPRSRGRVIRGGSYGIPATFARSACRMQDNPTFRSAQIGVRAARSLID